MRVDQDGLRNYQDDDNFKRKLFKKILRSFDMNYNFFDICFDMKDKKA